MFTFARNTTQSNLMQNLLSSARSQGISVSVVVMGNSTNKLGLVTLVEHEHNLFTGDAVDVVSPDVPWIVDLICQGTFYFFGQHIPDDA